MDKHWFSLREAAVFIDKEFLADASIQGDIDQSDSDLNRQVRDLILAAVLSGTVEAWLTYGNDRPTRFTGELLHDPFLSLDINHDRIRLPSYFDHPCSVSISGDQLHAYLRRAIKPHLSRRAKRVNRDGCKEFIKERLCQSDKHWTKKPLLVALRFTGLNCPERVFDELCKEVEAALNLIGYFSPGRPRKNIAK